MKNIKQKEGDVKVIQQGNLVATHWTYKKQVCLFSTKSSPEMTSDASNKIRPTEVDIPKLVLRYNNYMGGVDLVE